MATSSRAKIVTPDVLSSAQVPADMLAMGQSLEPSLTPRFPTTAARDSAITAAVRNGDTLMAGEGFRCYVQGSGEWEWDSAAWVPVGPRIAAIKAYTGTPSVTSTAAGPAGVPNINTSTFTANRSRLYRSTLTGILLGDTANAQFRLYVTDESGVRLDIRDEIVATGNPGQKYFSYPTAEYVLAAGTHTIGCTFTLIIGGGTLTLLSMTLTIADLGPA